MAGVDGKIEVSKSINKLWMVRRCEEYLDEFQACSSLKGKFYQLYVLGEVDPDKCDGFHSSFEDCKLWKKKMDKEAAERIIKREESRIQKRMDASNLNDVWEKRDLPPENWNGPLPQHLKDQSESSLLSTHNLDQGVTNDVRAREYRGRVSTLIPSCTIS